MFAKEDFITLINVPNKVAHNEIESLSNLLDHYPYFLTARLLKTKGLKNIDSIDFEDNLRKTAAYTPNREILYRLLMQETLQENIKASSKDEFVDKVAEQPIEALKIEKEPIREKISPLEQQILEEAVTASLSYDLEPALSIENKNPEIELNSLTSENITDKKALDTTQLNSFTSWLKKVNETKATDYKSTTETQKSSSIETLVDQFIKTEPRIGANKKEFFSPENIARLSLVENLDFVTETLAKIYAQQGNFSKAILAFEKLSLKYPEKRTYFASQIKNLKEQLKQK